MDSRCLTELAQERMAYVNNKIDESCHNEPSDIQYWCGYKDGILSILRKIAREEIG